MARGRNGERKNGNGASLGFEAEMFKTADKLRGNMEPSEYKHVALGLIFLKYISDAFEAKHAALVTEDPQAAEDRDEYLAENIFWVPKEARWSYLKANAKQTAIAKNGARTLDALRLATDPDADHTQLLDSLKQIALYTDCLGNKNWSKPNSIIDGELAQAMTTLAGCSSEMTTSRNARFGFGSSTSAPHTDNLAPS
jgi:type I restriction-modification system DNA methylase subunit